MKFAWQAKGIPRNITELEKLVNEPRLPEKIAADKDSYLEYLTGGAYTIEKKKWNAVQKLGLSETAADTFSSTFFREGKADLSNAEIWQNTLLMLI